LLTPAPLAHSRTDCAAQTDIPQAECEALVRLFENTGGPRWEIGTGWNDTAQPCTWYGVTCSLDSGTRHVIQIDLTNNGLAGSIPDLSALNELRALSLSGNQLSGGMLELGAFTHLQALDLSDNQLRGEIPDPGALTSLQYLDLSDNQLSGPLPSLDALTSLERLYLSGNQLSGPLPSLNALTNLERLLLSDNQLSGPLPSLNALTSLERLSLSNNQLSGPLPGLSRLRNLAHLSLSNNRFTGPIPPLDELTNLKTLYLANNALSGPLPAFDTLPALQRVSLANNALSGEIPPSLADLQELQLSYLRYNKLYATEPQLRAFLDAQEPGWSDTQTVPPTGIAVQTITRSSVQLTWEAIPYVMDGGYYRIWARRLPGGPYEMVGITESKRAESYTVVGLEPGTYAFLIETVTPPHGQQQNELISAPGGEVTVSVGGTIIFLPFITD
jgi:Leucine-rich repeat (LRR) protein